MITLGIGILISAVLMNLSYASKVRFNLETEARKMGMVYPTELKVMEYEPQGE